MKYTVISQIAKWLEENNIPQGNKQNNTIDTDVYTIYSKEELGATFTNYDNRRYNFRINASDGSKAAELNSLYGKGVKLFELVKTPTSEIGWVRNQETAIYLSDTPSKSSLEQLKQWFAKNTQFTPFPTFETSDFDKSIKDFICKINETKTLNVQTNYESIEAFFNDSSDKSYDDNESLVIIAVDTKMPIIKLEKQYSDICKVFRFIVDITADNGDNFSVKTTIDSKSKFNDLLKSTINSLREFQIFYKYADDLETCL